MGDADGAERCDGGSSPGGRRAAAAANGHGDGEAQEDRLVLGDIAGESVEAVYAGRGAASKKHDFEPVGLGSRGGSFHDNESYR